MARSAIEKLGDIVEMGLADARQIRSLGQVLAQQAVEVFVAAALLGRVRRGEVAGGVQGDIDQAMLSKLAAVVPRERVDAPAYRIGRMQDRPHSRFGLRRWPHGEVAPDRFCVRPT